MTRRAPGIEDLYSEKEWSRRGLPWCPRAQLLTGAAWDAACGPVLNDLQLPVDPAELLASRAGNLDAVWRHVAAGLDADAGVRIDDEGRLHVKKDPAITDPPSLTDLRKRCEAMMPQVEAPGADAFGGRRRTCKNVP